MQIVRNHLMPKWLKTLDEWLQQIEGGEEEEEAMEEVL
jgi:hypothetical protein